MSPRPRCVCVWLEERCPNPATQEDGLCDWCAPHGARTEAQLRANPKACIGSDGRFFGLSGAGELHDFPLAEARGARPMACWYPESDRTLAH